MHRAENAIEIKSIEEIDLIAILKLEQENHIAPWEFGIIENIYNLQGIHLKLEIEGEIIGYLFCSTVIDEAHLLNIVIDQRYQNRGFGKLLLTHLIQLLEDQNYYTLFLEVRESNARAIHLYNLLGFNVTGKRKGYYPTQDKMKEDAIIMAYTFLLL